MASCQIVFNKARSLMSEGQIANWRKWTYDNLKAKEKFSLKDLNALEDIYPSGTTPLQMQEAMLSQIQEDIILGTISHEDIVFIICDSSVMCSHTIDNMLASAKDFIKNDNSKFIIIDTHIGHAENTYKMINMDKYTCVDFTILKDNLDIMSCKKENSFNNTVVIKTNFFIDNHILTYLEDNLLNKKKWIKGCRNEMNDDAQLQILAQLVEYFPHSNGIMFSNDRALANKTDKKGIDSDINLYSMSMK